MDEDLLIIEFMELQEVEQFNGKWYVRNGLTGFVPVQYRSSWDWIMPVVSKIKQELIGCTAKGSFRLEGNLKNALWCIDIEATYRVVVEFIQWLNAQKIIDGVEESKGTGH